MRYVRLAAATFGAMPLLGVLLLPACTPPSGTTFTAYTTLYGWPDNTPPGGAISHPVIHKTAGGVGTYPDPVTVAVGHSIIGSRDILDYPAGTRFYVPALHKYFIVEDTCGDGPRPQNGPCHVDRDHPAVPQLDLWLQGSDGVSASRAFACEDALTAVRQMVQNPDSGYPVDAAPMVTATRCAHLYG